MSLEGNTGGGQDLEIESSGGYRGVKWKVIKEYVKFLGGTFKTDAPTSGLAYGAIAHAVNDKVSRR